jgi:NADH:ubiquinone oxidoreductase subunit 4 (subunit M)
LSSYAIPLLLGILIALLSSLLVWGFLRLLHSNPNTTSPEAQDRFIIALLLLSALAMGVFLTYLLLGFQN